MRLDISTECDDCEVEDIVIGLFSYLDSDGQTKYIMEKRGGGTKAKIVGMLEIVKNTYLSE